MQLNRKLTPELNSIDKIKIVEAEKICLSNGIDHYIINAGTQDVIKMDLIFEAGDEHHALKVVGQATNHLIDDGTKNKSAVQIASEIESIGASIECNCDIHNATITLYVLGKFFEPALKLIYELITEADFPENEVSIYAHRNKQQLLVNSEKVNFIAQQEFRKALFGSTHIYGRNQEGSDFDKINSQNLREFFTNHYKGRAFKIITSGCVNDKILFTIDSILGQLTISEKIEKSVNYSIPEISNKKYTIPKPGAIQNAIRIGKTVCNRRHPDYTKLAVLNTILGGYFGSRLMRNLREEKGFTYGIGSGIIHLKNVSFISIGTEVGSNVSQLALTEIYNEIESLRQELVPMDELNLVINYMQGAFIRNIDGPFALSEMLKNMIVHSLDYDYYYNYLAELKMINPASIIKVAEKWINPVDMTEIIAGNL